MSVNKNADAMTNAQGEFRNRVPPSEPMTTKGHAPGVLVGNDAYPEFNLETHPPGTAPADRSFQPQPRSEIPGQADNWDATASTKASDTLPGATSADVHQGYGHPGSGMTSQEAHGGKRKKDGSGLEGVGASGSDPQHKFHHDRPYETGHRGVENNAEDYAAGAENVVPVSAEELAAERR